MFSAGMISGVFQRMLDIIENINKNTFQVFVAYKPEYCEWGSNEFHLIRQSGAFLTPIRGSLLFDPRGFWDLWMIIRKMKIDILHSWDVLGVPARFIASITGIKIVEHWGNPPPAIFSEISLKHYIINKLSSPLVDGFIACSNGVMDQFRKEKPVCLRNKIRTVVHNCIKIPDTDKYESKKLHIFHKYGINPENTVLTNIGYFNDQKAQTDLIYAFQQLDSERDNITLIIVGWGRLEKKLKELAASLDLSKKIIFTGKCSRSQVFEVLSITDIFLLSSHWEGFGIVLIEAMAFAKPVISTDTHGAREVIENGKTGILVPIGKPDQMAESVIKLLDQPEQMKKMGQKGFERLIRYFTCEQFIKKYEIFYRKVLLS